MRTLPLALLLLALPATAQVDPDLVGTWTLDEVEQAPRGEMKVLSMTLVITAEGGLVATMKGARPDGSLRSETEEEQITTRDGQIDDGRSPIQYVLLDADTLRLFDERLALRFRRTSH